MRLNLPRRYGTGNRIEKRVASLPGPCPASRRLQPRPLPSFPSLAVQALAQLPIACSPGPCPASRCLQSRPLPSFLLLAVQALAQLPVACSPGPHPASCCLQYSTRLERKYEQQPTEEWNIGGRSHNDVAKLVLLEHHTCS